MGKRQRRSVDMRRRPHEVLSRRTRVAAGTGLTLGAALGMSSSAGATVFTVDTLGGGATDNECVTSCSLRDALQVARDNNNAPTVDRVLFQSGLTGTITLTAGQLPFIDEPLEVLGPGPGVLTVSGNNASRIFYIATPAFTDVTISGLRLTGGDQPGDPGGAILNDSAELTIRNTVISGNSSSAGGGGLYQRDGRGMIEGSTISGNTVVGSEQGAGVVSHNSALEITRSTISGNVGTMATGGGIYFNSADTGYDLNVKNSTISGNSALNGGGIESNGINSDPLLEGTIVANNVATHGPDLDSFVGGVSWRLSFSLVENTSGAPITSTVPGSNLLGVDPQLGPLAANGGPTPTHGLAPTSPALDKGRATGTDQRGSARPIDLSFAPNSTATGANAADIGAFELKASIACRGRPATMLARGGTTSGTGGPDVIVGTPAADVIRARGKKDRVCAGAGRDRVIGGGGADRLFGERGKDKLKGGAGRDRLVGGPGRDILLGGGGLDQLIGGPGRDRQRQ